MQTIKKPSSSRKLMISWSWSESFTPPGPPGPLPFVALLNRRTVVVLVVLINGTPAMLIRISIHTWNDIERRRRFEYENVRSHEESKRRPHEQVFTFTSFPWQISFARVDGVICQIVPWPVSLLKSCHASFSTRRQCQGKTCHFFLFTRANKTWMSRWKPARVDDAKAIENERTEWLHSRTELRPERRRIFASAQAVRAVVFTCFALPFSSITESHASRS